jgi:branched-chain amino acid transport system substrate-binding protein
VRYVIGETCSSASIAVSEIANERGVVQISPSSTNTALTQYPDGSLKPYIFRACFIDPFQGHVMAKFARSRGFRTAYLMFNPSDEYGLGLTENFERVFVENGGEIVGKSEYGEESDFSALILDVKASGAEMLFLPDYYPVVNVVTTLARRHEVRIVMMGGDGWDSTELDLTAAEGAFFSNHYDPLAEFPWVKAFAERYQLVYGNLPDAIAALNYDTANLLLTAIERTGRDDPAVVKDVLAEIEWEGVTGPIRFDRYHNPIKPAVVMQIREGKVYLVDMVGP